MYQQHLDLQFPLTQQLGLNLDVPVDQRPKFYVDTSKLTIDSTFNSVGTISSYFTVSDSNGSECDWQGWTIQDLVLKWKTILG